MITREALLERELTEAYTDSGSNLKFEDWLEAHKGLYAEACEEFMRLTKTVKTISPTKGEWFVATVDCGESNDEIVTEINGCPVNIAAIFGACKYSVSMPGGEPEPHYEVSKEEAVSNAKLISAAPELLNSALMDNCFPLSTYERKKNAEQFAESIGWKWDMPLIQFAAEYRALAIVKAQGDTK